MGSVALRLDKDSVPWRFAFHANCMHLGALATEPCAVNVAGGTDGTAAALVLAAGCMTPCCMHTFKCHCTNRAEPFLPCIADIAALMHAGVAEASHCRHALTAHPRHYSSRMATSAATQSSQHGSGRFVALPSMHCHKPVPQSLLVLDAAGALSLRRMRIAVPFRAAKCKCRHSRVTSHHSDLARPHSTGFVITTSLPQSLTTNLTTCVSAVPRRVQCALLACAARTCLRGMPRMRHP